MRFPFHPPFPYLASTCCPYVLFSPSSYCTGRMTDPTANITPNALPVPAAALNACCAGIRLSALCSPTTVPPTSAPIPNAIAATFSRFIAMDDVEEAVGLPLAEACRWCCCRASCCCCWSCWV